jgi:60 kDa SS-A/Ro ribonucleoprotein
MHQLRELQRAKYDIWFDLVKSNKLGFQAMVMNLRNMIEAANEAGKGRANELFTLVAEKLQDERAVQKSRMFPVQLYTAFEAVQHQVPPVLEQALTKALDHSCANIGALGEDAWVIIDVSGSMQGKPLTIASIFAAALFKANKGNRMKVTMFSDRADHIDLSGSRNQTVLGIAQYIQAKSYGGGTNLASALNLKSSIGFDPKSVLVFSDMQIDNLTGSYGWGSSRGNTFPDVSKLFKKSTVKIAFNLNAYETTPLSESQGFFQMSGYSDKVFKFMNLINEGESIVEALSAPM